MVVVGAGLAGLSAALKLRRAGVDVLVLESAERVGGRVLTLREPFEEGLYAEAGGEFVDSGHTVLHAYLRCYGLAVMPMPDGEQLFSIGGNVLRGESLADLGEEPTRDEERLEAALEALAQRVVDVDRPWESAPELDQCSVGEWLDEQHLGPIVRTFQQVWRTVDYAVRPECISLLELARDEALWSQPSDLPSGRVRGGIDRLPLAMAAELGDRVRLGGTVTAIRQDGDVAWVTCKTGGVEAAVRGRRVVLAVPIPALRRIALEPALPPEPARAIAELGFGTVTKIMLQVRRRFWEDQGLNGRVFTDGLVQGMYEATAGQPGERGILTVYTADRAANTLASLSEEQRVTACLEVLEHLYPGSSDQVEQTWTAAWTAHSTTGGAYSHFQPGQMARFGRRLTEPFGRLHFAGEHTDRWQATMNGALASGQRVAGEVLALLRGEDRPSSG